MNIVKTYILIEKYSYQIILIIYKLSITMFKSQTIKKKY